MIRSRKSDVGLRTGDHNTSWLSGENNMKRGRRSTLQHLVMTVQIRHVSPEHLKFKQSFSSRLVGLFDIDFMLQQRSWKVFHGQTEDELRVRKKEQCMISIHRLVYYFLEETWRDSEHNYLCSFITMMCGWSRIRTCHGSGPYYDSLLVLDQQTWPADIYPEGQCAVMTECCFSCPGRPGWYAACVVWFLLYCCTISPRDFYF